MNSDDLQKENLKLKNKIKQLEEKLESFKMINRKCCTYILNHSTYKLPNYWEFHGDISYIYDLLITKKAYKK